MFMNVKKPVIHKVTVPKRTASTPQKASPQAANAQKARRNVSNEKLRRSADTPVRTPATKVSSKRKAPAQILSSSSDASDTEAEESVAKRPKAQADISCRDPNRKRRSIYIKAKDEAAVKLPLISGADLTSGEKAGQFSPAFETEKTASEVQLQYPSSASVERFQLVVPRESDNYKPLEDIIQTVEHICQYYFSEAKSTELNDDNTGFSRRLKRAITHRSVEDFMAVVNEFNTVISKALESSDMEKLWSEVDRPPLPLIERILSQVYARTVSPRVETLRRYENGTDNVYGEMLPRFVSQIIKDTRLRHDQIFVDLGSGVGNVVLQTALEVGCQSWGCEMMTNPCDLADIQAVEFYARCRLWGLVPGMVTLLRGDFLENKEIGDVLKRADVILVNNQAFNPDLNDKLTLKFLDLKEGARIVSLKSFVPSGFRMQARNMHDPRNLLRVSRKEYGSRCVSWTDNGGEYYVATKDSKRLEEFQKSLK